MTPSPKTDQSPVDDCKREISLFIASLIGLQFLSLLFFSISFALGSRYWNITYLDPGDLWGDFTKYISSFSLKSSDVPISPIPFLREFDQSYKAYIENGSPYSNDPRLIGDRLSNFHMPPFSVLVGKFLHFLSITWGPSYTYFSLVLICAFVLALMILNFSRRYKINTPLICLVYAGLLACYPIQFALFKGNTGAIITTFCILLSAILLRLDSLLASYVFAVIGALNRPNMIFLPVLIFTYIYSSRFQGSQNDSISRNARGAIIGIILFLASYSLFAVVLYLVDPSYNPSTFNIALKTFHYHMAFGDSGIAFGSSLFSLFKLVVKSLIFHSFLAPISYSSYIALDKLTVAFGVGMSIYALRQFIARKITLEAAWFFLIVFNLMISPVFADYHLGIFFSVFLILIPACSNNNQLREMTQSLSTLQLRYSYTIIYCAFMMSPMQVYILPSLFPWGVGVFIRPLLVLLAVYDLLISKSILVNRIRDNVSLELMNGNNLSA